MILSFVGWFRCEGAEYFDPVHGVAVATNSESFAAAEPSVLGETETPLRLGNPNHLNHPFHTHEDFTNRKKVEQVKGFPVFIILP